MNVKICGIRSLETAIAACESGATHLGLNFITASRRYIDEAEAGEIARHLQGKVKLVGVFRDMPLEVVNDLAVRYQLDYVQLHGAETPEYCRRVVAPVIKAVLVDPTDSTPRIISRMRQYTCELFLLDRAVQGRGAVIDLIVAREIAGVLPCFVAGGLTVENVADVVTSTHPYGIDVAGGIEVDYHSDPHKMHQFVKNALLSAK